MSMMVHDSHAACAKPGKLRTPGLTDAVAGDLGGVERLTAAAAGTHASKS